MLRPATLRLTILAPRSTAKLTPLAMVDAVPDSLRSSTRTGMMRASGATPATPAPLSVAAAAMPAIWVPWPVRSWGVVSSLTKSKPGTSLGARSGWSRSTPLSTMAMTTPAPRLTGHACWARTWARPHCRLKSGSSEARAGTAEDRVAPTVRLTKTVRNRPGRKGPA